MVNRVPLFAAVLLISACTPAIFYDGPRRPRSELALITATDAMIFTVDSMDTTSGARSFNVPLEVLPGAHLLEVSLFLSKNDGGIVYTAGSRRKVCMNAEAGGAYTVHAEMLRGTWRPYVVDAHSGFLAGGEGDACLARGSPVAEPEPRASQEPIIPERDAPPGHVRAAYEAAKRLRLAGHYALAMSEGQHALELALQAHGEGHPEVATRLDLLGALHLDQELYAQVEPFYARSLAIREAALGKNHPEVAASLEGLANLYTAQHLEGRAEPLHERALAIRKEAFGEAHPDVATSLQGLANIHAAQGRWTRAQALYQRALAIREKALGEAHPDVATTLNALAALYEDRELYDQAEPLYVRALAIREAALGQFHPEVATSLRNLGLLYEAQGWKGQPEPLYKRALAIREAALGKNHPKVAQTLNDLAGLYLFRGPEFHEQSHLYAHMSPGTSPSRSIV